MARPLRIEYEGAVYHVTSRGNERSDIYKSDRDRERFLGYLETAHKRFNIIIHAYCLLSNHYHFIVETPFANLGKFMQFLNSSYTMYFNTKRKRNGHLFQGRYKSILVDKDNYMQELSRYIHLNPVRANIEKRPEDYKWSSYNYYLNEKNKPEYLGTDFTLQYFNRNRKRYREFVEAGMAKKTRDIFEDIKAGFILGDKNFVQEIKKKYLQKDQRREDLPELRRLKKEYITKDTISKVLDKEEKNDMLFAYYLHKYTDETLQGIVKIAYKEKRSSSSISKTVSRIEEKRRKDKEFNKRLRLLEKKMSMSRSDP